MSLIPFCDGVGGRAIVALGRDPAPAMRRSSAVAAALVTKSLPGPMFADAADLGQIAIDLPTFMCEWRRAPDGG